MTKNIFVGGIEKVALSSCLLDLIIMMQDYKKYQLSRSMFLDSQQLEREDYEAETEKLFKSIDKNILSKYKLSHNKYSYDKIMMFKVTDKMLACESNELEDKFTF